MTNSQRILKNDRLIFELITDPNYRIHENGTIETCVQLNGRPGASWRQAGGSNTPDGYMVIRYKGTLLRIHRIVWAKFHQHLAEKMVINHIDGVKSNNSIDNLEMVSESENQIHAYRHLGKIPNRGAAKLSWKQVDDIRKDRSEGMTLRELKEKYCVSKTALSYICSGKTYNEGLKDGSN